MCRLRVWLRHLSDNELTLATVATVIAALCYVGWGFAIEVNWRTALDGAHTEAAGFLFDIALFGVIFSWFRRRWEARATTEQAHHEFSAYSSWDETQGILLKVEIIRRLTRGGYALPSMTLVQLPGAALGGADLGGAKLNAARLTGADLIGADLSRADLSGADLRDAVLVNADLSFATLRLANLEGADLDHASLKGADLANANLTRAQLSEVDLEGADLRGAMGLDEAQLAKSKNWMLAFRDPAYAYGESIPASPNDS